MKELKILPSSPIIQEMNDAQWVWSYLNIIEDEKEQEELWKTRLKYMGLFVNPEAVQIMVKNEAMEKGETVNFNSENNYENEDIYQNSQFEDELKKVLAGEQCIEIPAEGETVGNPNMSSDDFINSCQNNIDQFTNIQEHIDSKRQIYEHAITNDLDVIEFDE